VNLLDTLKKTVCEKLEMFLLVSVASNIRVVQRVRHNTFQFIY